MGKSSYSAKIATGALALLGYLGNITSAEAQSQTRTQPTRQNRIYSSNPCLSATGEGVYLKNFCHDLDLSHDSNVSIGEMFGLSARSGKLSYTAVSGKDGIKQGISYLKSGAQTPEKKATISYLEKLLRSTAENGKNSVTLFDRAVSDGVINESDSLFSNDGLKIREGLYAIVSKSSNNSMPILVNVSSNKFGREQYSKVSSKDSLTEGQYARDSLENVEKEKRRKFVGDSIAREDSAGKVRSQFVKDSTEKATEAEARRKFVADSVAEANKPRTRFGVEAGYGLNREIVAGAFVEVPLASRLSAEFYANYHVQAGDSSLSIGKPDTTTTDRQLIGLGTYKQKVVEITPKTEEKSVAEAGVGLMLRASDSFSKDLRLHLRGGVSLANLEETLEGKSTISFERNMRPLGEPQVITNSMEGKGQSKIKPAFSVGVLYDIGKNFTVGASFNQVGKRSGGRINLRILK